MGILEAILGRRRPERKARVGARVPIEERAEMRRIRDGSEHSVILADLSVGGARIATPLRLMRNEELTLVVSAGKARPFEFGAKVVAERIRAGRVHRDYGVRFVAIRAGEMSRLREFVAMRDDARRSGLLWR